MDTEKYLRILNTSLHPMCRLKCDYKEGKAHEIFYMRMDEKDIFP